jgi:hypothetical protein
MAIASSEIRDPGDDSSIGHYFQLHAIITEDSPINFRIFQEREDTAKWLGVPIERLAPKFAAG